MTDESLVCIILLNWNGWSDTLECLESITALEYPDVDVIVVDNGSTDESVERIRAWCNFCAVPYVEYHCDQRAGLPALLDDVHHTQSGIRRVSLLAVDRNLGFCAGNNLGLAHGSALGAEYFLILNNDTVATPHFLRPLVAAARKNDQAGLLGGIVCFEHDRQSMWFAGGDFDTFLEGRHRLYCEPLSRISDAGPLDTGWVTGCMMLIPRSTYESLGGFDETLFIYCEDFDYSLRVKAAGKALLLVPQSIIYHKCGRSLGTMGPLSYYYGTRNRLRLKSMYLPPLKTAAFLAYFLASRLPRYGTLALRGRWDLVKAGSEGIRDYLLRRSGKWRAHEG